MSKNELSYQASYIEDGHTLKGFVAEVPGLHGPLCFEYRPLLKVERSIVYDKIKRLPPAAAEEESDRVLASRLVDWDLVTTQGEAVPRTKEHVAKLQSVLSSKLFAIVTGVAPTDVKSEWNGTQETVNDQYELLLSGPVAAEDAALKN